MASLQRQFKETQDRLVESNKVITSNQEVISYLNEEINKWQIGLRATSGGGQGQGNALGSASKLSEPYYTSSSPYLSSSLGGGSGGGQGASLGLESYPYSSSLSKRYSRDNHTHHNDSHAPYDAADPYDINALDHQQYAIPMVSPEHTNATATGSGNGIGSGDGNKDQNDMYLRGMYEQYDSEMFITTHSLNNTLSELLRPHTLSTPCSSAFFLIYTFEQLFSRTLP